MWDRMQMREGSMNRTRKKSRKWLGMLCLLFLLAGLGSCGVQERDPENSENSFAEVVEQRVENVQQSSEAVEQSTENAQQSSEAEDESVTPQGEEAASYFAVHYFDVGQADAALVCCDGQYLLIDGGNKDDSGFLYSYMKNQGITHLDYVVATHPHEDHVGGIAGALNYATAGTVYCSVTESENEAFLDFNKYVEKAGTSITVPEVGESFSVGSARVQVVGVNGGEAENDRSIVLRICYGETSFLFTGDANQEAEQAVLASGYAIDSTVLKVGHHGGNNSTGEGFLNQVHPSVAVISVGVNNGYGHPSDKVLTRLEAAEVQIYRTDLYGNIVIRSDGTDITIEVEKEPGLFVSEGTELPVSTETSAGTETSASTETSAGTEAEASTEPGTSKEPAVGTESSANAEKSPVYSYAVNGRNGKIHKIGACPATGKGENAMKKPVYFETYQDAEDYSISIAPTEENRKCGNCYRKK